MHTVSNSWVSDRPFVFSFGLYIVVFYISLLGTLAFKWEIVGGKGPLTPMTPLCVFILVLRVLYLSDIKHDGLWCAPHHSHFTHPPLCVLDLTPSRAHSLLLSQIPYMHAFVWILL